LLRLCFNYVFEILGPVHFRTSHWPGRIFCRGGQF